MQRHDASGTISRHITTLHNPYLLSNSGFHAFSNLVIENFSLCCRMWSKNNETFQKDPRSSRQKRLEKRGYER